MKPLAIVGIMAAALFFLASPLRGAFGGGVSMKKRRALAKARRAKKLKAKARKK